MLFSWSFEAQLIKGFSSQPGCYINGIGKRGYSSCRHAKAALWVAENVHPILQNYKKNHAAKSYKLIITGHSLGAGVAMALGHHLISIHPEVYNSSNLKALGFGCPAMAGLSFANDARSWATNYVYDFDTISRLSLHSIKPFSSVWRYLLKTKSEERR